jgi:hypothetical protein
MVRMPRTAHRKLLVLHHTSHVTHDTSHITHHTSHNAHHTSHITRHTSHSTSPKSLFKRLSLAATPQPHDGILALRCYIHRWFVVCIIWLCVRGCWCCVIASVTRFVLQSEIFTACEGAGGITTAANAVFGIMASAQPIISIVYCIILMLVLQPVLANTSPPPPLPALSACTFGTRTPLTTALWSQVSLRARAGVHLF